MICEKMQQKYNKLIWIIEAFFISFACTVEFGRPLLKANYAETIDFYTSQVMELLGNYRFSAVLIFAIAYVLLRYCDRLQISKEKGNGYFLPLFFSFCLYLGRSYAETDSWQYCFSGFVNLTKFLGAMVGMTLLLHRLLFLLIRAYKRVSESTFHCKFSDWIFGKKCFVKLWALLFICWFPMILLSYPGNLCYDVIGQIDQVVGNLPYSAHHPLLHTLLVGGFVKLGGVAGSYEIGLFLYVCVQALMLSSALAGTLWWLGKQEFPKGKVSHILLLFILGIYVLAPMYSNVVSTALKDVPFMAAFVWYMIMLAELCQRKECFGEVRFMAGFVAVQVLVSLLRNNGFYVVLLTGIALCFLWWKDAGKKERLRRILFLLVLPVVLSKGMDVSMKTILSAQDGKAAEIFSLPFQQTARYLQLYVDEMTMEQKTAIEAVLGEVNQVAAAYNPEIADPVKAFYYQHEEVTGKELLKYFLVWGQCLLEHPGVYFEAFFTHVYGWFDPQVSNAVRYEAYYELIPRQGLFPNANKIALFLYRFADRVTPLGLLQNVGAYTWAMLLLLRLALLENKKQAVLLIPLLVSLLICMASPCFYLHPRYAFPYMFTLPFLYGFMERSKE